MKKLLLLVPIILVVAGCPRKEKDYWPLSVGNIWEYQMVSKVTTPDTTITMTDTMKVEVTGETTLNNNTKVFEVLSKSGTHTDTTYYQKTDEYVFSYADKAETKPDTVLSLPLEEGKSWTVRKDSLYTETMKVIKKESVTVPAGTYDDCWKAMNIYTDGTIAETAYVWVAPDVGWIKMTMSEADTNFTMETKIELLNATIK